MFPLFCGPPTPRQLEALEAGRAVADRRKRRRADFLRWEVEQLAAGEDLEQRGLPVRIGERIGVSARHVRRILSAKKVSKNISDTSDAPDTTRDRHREQECNDDESGTTEGAA